MTQETNVQNKQGGLSGSTLKWIAMVTMIIDHMGAAILLPLLNSGQLETFDYSLAYTAYTSFRLIGRIAFPIFCFLLVEGFFYTSNKQKYAIRLEIPFNLAISQQFFDLAYQNVFFTLLLGLLAIWLASIMKYRWLGIIPIVLLAIAAEYFNTDYGMFGVMLIGALYVPETNVSSNPLLGLYSSYGK